MDAKYAINLAKTIYREAYEQGDVEKLLSVFAADGFTDIVRGAAQQIRAGGKDSFAKPSRATNC